MALTVTGRPAKDIDGSTSTWNALNLPVQYKLNSDLFPTNSVDADVMIMNVINNGGFMQLTLLVDPVNILEGETLQIKSANIDSFNGVYKVKEIIDPTNYVLYTAYDSTFLSGNVQKYYNNYFTEVRVYAGLPTWHDEQATKPISEVGTLRVIPDSNNDIIASFSGIIKSDVNLQKQLLEGIDLNHFTGFYIEWREGYDENVGGDIETAYTSWNIDQVSDCGVDVITNGDFATDLSDWSQVDLNTVSEPFVWSGGLALSSLGTYHKSKVIYQEVNLTPNIEYSITLDVTRSLSESTTFVIYGSNDLVNFKTFYSDVSSNNLSIAETIIPDAEYQYIGFHFYGEYGNPPTTDVTVDNIVVTPTVCEYLFWGSNSSLQFQSSRGGNMYDYISGRLDSKFMTNFDTPTLFNDNYFDLSMILNSSVSGVQEDIISNGSLVWLNASAINQADSTPVATWADSSINGNDFTQVTPADQPTFKKVNANLNGMPSVQFTSAGKEYMDSLFTSSNPMNVYVVYEMTSLATSNPIFDSDLTGRLVIYYSSSSNARFYGGEGGVLTGAAPLANTLYIDKYRIDGENSYNSINDVMDVTGDTETTSITGARLGGFWDLSTGLEGSIAEFIVTEDEDPCLDYAIRKYLGDKYDSYELNSVSSSTKEYSNGTLINEVSKEIDYKDSGVYRLTVPPLNDLTDTVEFKLFSAESCNMSETKTINVDNSCANQEIYLTWLNSLDGWEYWKFTAEKSHNLNIENKETIKRNVFADWDNDFINGDTQNDVISIGAYKEIDVFSQYLTRNEVEAISAIKHSIKVMVLDGVNPPVTVIVDSDSITVFNDGDDETLQTIRFSIQYPDIQIQSQ